MFRLLSSNNTTMPITTSAGRMPGIGLLPRQSSCSCMSSAYGGGARESSPNRRTPRFYRRVARVRLPILPAITVPPSIGEMYDFCPAADRPGDVVFHGEYRSEEHT